MFLGLLGIMSGLLKNQVPINGFSLFYTKTQRPCQSFETKPQTPPLFAGAGYIKRSLEKGRKKRTKSFLFLVTVVYMF